MAKRIRGGKGHQRQEVRCQAEREERGRPEEFVLKGKPVAQLVTGARILSKAAPVGCRRGL